MILYINGNYPFHSLHKELVNKLADRGDKITVFVPLRGKEYFGKYDSNNDNVKVIYSNILTIPDRIFFINKIKKIVEKIEETIDISEIECILAGTVYSDGAVAYLLHKKYNIPFSVTVRETDVTYHMKWRPYLNSFIRNMLKEVSQIIFISPSYQRYFEKFKCDKNKYKTIPNAVNDYWYEGINNNRTLHSPLSVIYVGEISKRKNVNTIIKVIALLHKKGIKTELNIIGAGKEQSKCELLSGRLGIKEYVRFHGWQDSKENIKRFYECADIFAMPSIRETFGTVYIEALSQGLPIIYTKGQGIDGYFDQGTIGFACDPKNVDEIAAAILMIVNDYSSYSARALEKSKIFQWTEVSKKYSKVLNDMRGR